MFVPAEQASGACWIVLVPATRSHSAVLVYGLDAVVHDSATVLEATAFASRHARRKDHCSDPTPWGTHHRSGAADSHLRARDLVLLHDVGDDRRANSSESIGNGLRVDTASFSYLGERRPVCVQIGCVPGGFVVPSV